jgi:para-nitrobenzyl esterase
MKILLTTAALVAALAGASAGSAQQPARTGPPTLALADLPAKASLIVTTPAFSNGGDIPFENTQYKANTFPGLSWTKGPAETKAYAVIMQDNDLQYRGAFILHWTLFNLPGTMTTLPVAMTTLPPGAAYGPNYKGASIAYTGPKTPAGHKDHYHFEVFALDAMLPADAAGSGFDGLEAAMKGHVLASGEVVGIGQAPPAGS